MSGYRRFVSYIYAYKNGKKEKNAGFAKVEARGGNLRINIQLEHVFLETEGLDVYGFVRKGKKLYGIFLGEMQKGGNPVLRVETKEENIEGSGYSLKQLSGLWVKGNRGENYITIWDEEPVTRMELETEIHSPSVNDRELLKPAKEEETAPANPPADHQAGGETAEQNLPGSGAPKQSRESRSGSGTTEQSDESPSGNGTAGQIGRNHSGSGTAEQIGQISKDEGVPRPAFAAPSREAASFVEEAAYALGFPQEERLDTPASVSDESTGNPEVLPSVSEADSDSASTVQAAEIKEIPQAAPAVLSVPAAPDKPAECKNLNGVRAQESAELARGNGGEPSAGEKTCAPKEDIAPEPGNKKWEVFSKNCPHVNPFKEGEARDCVRITPKDAQLLQKEGFRPSGNNFLLHGYYNFHHLICGYFPDGTFFLGVPGFFTPKEQRAAASFGFPIFRDAREGRRGGRFGYWCRPM